MVATAATAGQTVDWQTVTTGLRFPEGRRRLEDRYAR